MPWFAFKNNHSKPVSVAVMKEDKDACGSDGGWMAHGWWNLNPGETQTVIYSENRYLYFYAHAGDGTWWGDPNGPEVFVNPYAKFDQCYLIGTSTWDEVRMARADGGSFLGNHHTQNLNG
jgi:hypothetical protein